MQPAPGCRLLEVTQGIPIANSLRNKGPEPSRAARLQSLMSMMKYKRKLVCHLHADGASRADCILCTSDAPRNPATNI